jgi:hypothetical protein
MAKEATNMNTPRKMKLSEMTEGQRCLVVIGKNHDYLEEAEIMHISPLVQYEGQRTDTPYVVFVRFDDGEEMECHPANIRQAK